MENGTENNIEREMQATLSGLGLRQEWKVKRKRTTTLQGHWGLCRLL